MHRPDVMDETRRRAEPDVRFDPEHPGRLDQARRETGSVAEEGRAQARRLLDETRSTLVGEAEGQAARLADGMRSVSRELASMADHSEQPDSGVAEVTRQLASEVGRVAGRIDHDGLDDTLESIRTYARRSPGRFLLGATVLGFATGRLLRNVDADEVGRAMRHQGDPEHAGSTSGDALGDAAGLPMASDLSGFATGLDGAGVESGSRR